jgi:hypothetical protein
MKSTFPKFLLLCLAISGIALAQQYSNDEALQPGVQAHEPAMFVATSAAYNNNFSCATNIKPLPPNKRRKPKIDAKKGRS